MSKYLFTGISSNQLFLPPFTQIIMLNFWRRVHVYYTHAPSSVVVVVVVHNVQRYSPLKPLGQSKPNFMWRILRKGEPKFALMVQVTSQVGRQCNKTKTFKIFFSGTGGPIYMELGM